MAFSRALKIGNLKAQLFLGPERGGEYIEDIYFFEVNTKYISSSAVKKISIFSRVRCTSENAEIFTARDEIYFVFAVKK